MTTGSTTLPPAADSRTPRWMWTALVLSLALNLLIVGVAASTMLHARSDVRHQRGSWVASYLATLPEARRAVLVPLYEARRAAVQPLRGKVKEARARARLNFAAEPFDRDQLIKSYREASDLRRQLYEVRGQWISKLAEKMTAQERRGFIEWRRKHHTPHRRHSGR